jgi:hypothetical protein
VRRKAAGDGCFGVRRRGPARGIRPGLTPSRRWRPGRLRGQLSPGHGPRGPLLAYRQAQVALARGADALAHGATGKGNDQVRFEVTYGRFAPHIARDRSLARVDDTVAGRSAGLCGQAHECPSSRRRATSSGRDGNLWHLSHEGGNLRTPGIRRAGTCSSSPGSGRPPGNPEEIVRGLRGGSAGHDRTARSWRPWTLVRTLNRSAGAHGVGRVDLVENRLVGIKSRGVYETPPERSCTSPTASSSDLVLDRDTLALQGKFGSRCATRSSSTTGCWLSRRCREALRRVRRLHRAATVTGDGQAASLLQGAAPRRSGRRSPRRPLPPGPGDVRSKGRPTIARSTDRGRVSFRPLTACRARARAEPRARRVGARGDPRPSSREANERVASPLGFPACGKTALRDQALSIDLRPDRGPTRLARSRRSSRPNLAMARRRVSREHVASARRAPCWSTPAAPTPGQRMRVSARPARWRPWPRLSLDAAPRKVIVARFETVRHRGGGRRAFPGEDRGRRS